MPRYPNGARTVVYKKGSSVPVYVSQNVPSDTGSSQLSDTGAAHDWIAANSEFASGDVFKVYYRTDTGGATWKTANTDADTGHAGEYVKA